MFGLRQYWSLLVRYLRPQKGAVALLGLLVIGAIILQLINPQLVRRFLDAAENERSLAMLLQTAGLFIAVALVAQILKVLGTYVGENVAWRATNELRADLALHCLRLDMDFHKTHKPGELIERVDGDVNQLANFFSKLVIELVSNLLLLVGVVVLLWLVDWRVGLSITFIALAGLLVLNRVNQTIVLRWQRVRQIESELFGYLEEWLEGTEEIQTSRAAPYILWRLVALLRRRWHAMQGAQRANVAIMSLAIVVPALAYVAAYLWGNRLFAGGLLTIGTLYVIFYYVDVIREPLWSIQRQVQDLQRAAASLNRIIELFSQEPVIRDHTGLALPAGPLAVHFENVSFAYADDPHNPVLQEIDFTLLPGRVLGLLGRTGSGKTTLTRLLLRFYDATAGGILLGREDQMVALPETSQAAIRARVGMVTQDVELFHASVRDNLTLFDEGIEDARILTALAELGLRSWLESLPEGLDTRLEAEGSLSAGEAQLLALGRVFLADVGLVILDEASSRLDPATEALLERALDRLLADRTVIIIAHRLGTVRRADEIMILDDGRVIEQGERDLLAADHRSHFFHLLQVGMEEALA